MREGSSTPVPGPRFSRASRLLLVAVLAVAAALRFWAVRAPYLHPEQELIPQNALAATLRHDWRPLFLFHGSAFLYVLRVVYTMSAVVGQLTGRWSDRVDMLASYVRDPWPFLIAGRVLVAAAGLATVWLVARLGGMLRSPAAGVAAAALLAVSFVHVRQSRHVWYDVPAGLATLAAVTAAVRALRVRTPGALAAAGALGGLAIAAKHPMAPVVVPVVLAAWWASTPGGRLRAALVTGVPALATYLLLCPYTVLELPTFLWWARAVADTVVEGGKEAASFPTLVWAGLGVVAPILAIAGFVVLARTALRDALVVAAFPVLYLAIIAAGQRIHVRYLAPAAPFVCLFAGIALDAAARRIAPRRAGLVLASLTALAGAGSLAQSAAFVRLLGREDTRLAAGRWIVAHVPPGTTIDVPAMNGYPNPVLPWNAQRIAATFPDWTPALLRRGLGASAATWPTTFQRGVFGDAIGDWRPTAPVVVTAEHPAALLGSNTPPDWIERLRVAGYRPVAEFRAFTPPIHAVFDPIDADYLPLARFAGVARPGPNITVWMPGASRGDPTSERRE